MADLAPAEGMGAVRGRALREAGGRGPPQVACRSPPSGPSVSRTRLLPCPDASSLCGTCWKFRCHHLLGPMWLSPQAPLCADPGQAGCAPTPTCSVAPGVAQRGSRAPGPLQPWSPARPTLAAVLSSEAWEAPGSGLCPPSHLSSREGVCFLLLRFGVSKGVLQVSAVSVPFNSR